MAGEARLLYHAVPAIKNCPNTPWNALGESEEERNEKVVGSKNMLQNERVVEEGRGCLEEISKENVWEYKRNGLNLALVDEVRIDDKWRDFDKFICNARINMNVRQVNNVVTEIT